MRLFSIIHTRRKERLSGGFKKLYFRPSADGSETASKMLDIKYIRENKEKVAQAAKNKNREVDLDRLLELDDQRRECIQQI